MAFDRTALSWKSLYNPQGKAVATSQLNDQQILSYLGNTKNSGALGSGWQYKNGSVSRIAAPPAGQAPPAGTPAPVNTNAPAGNPFNYAPVGPGNTGGQAVRIDPQNDPNNLGRFDRSSVRWKSLFMPVQGKPGQYKAVSIHQLTDAQVRNALGDPKNKGAIAQGWQAGPNGTITAAPTPTTPVQPAGNGGYFFNPWSDTLWSRRLADGTVVSAAPPSQNDQMLEDMSSVSQYRLPSAGAGNLLPGISLGDASSYLSQGGWQQGLIRNLMPIQQQLAGLDDNQGGRGTMYDIGRRGFLDSWDDKVNAAMGSLAARGMYSGGARSNSLAKAAEEKNQGLLQLDQQYGGLKRAELNNNIEQARRDYGLNALQSLLDNLIGKKQADTQEALA